MRKLIERSIIAIFSLYATYKLSIKIDLVFYFLISIIFSIVLGLLMNKKLRYTFYLAFIFLIFYDPVFLFYFPLIFYNIYMDFKKYSILFIPILSIYFSPMLILIFILSLYLAQSTYGIEKTLKENRNIRDNLKEDTLYLKKYNEQLKIDKEKNIHIAILTERNRIAREIHDSIGHAISSSILQVKALKILSGKDLEEPLNSLQDTLNNGMNDIRNSLQGLRNESFDLKNKIEDLIDEIPNLHVEFLYNMDEDLEYHLKFDILSVIKEAITNTLKHSNATKLNISLFSQPKFYSINIEDNGTKLPSLENMGIGLDYINETANKYNGLLNYKFEDGFKLHLALMKGK